MEYGKRFLLLLLSTILLQTPWLVAEQRSVESPYIDQALDQYIQNNCDINPIKVQGKINPQAHVVGEHCQLPLRFGQRLALVGSKHPLARNRRQDNNADVLSLIALPNAMVPGFGGLADGRQRVEMTTGFMPIQSFDSLVINKPPLVFKHATKSMMRDQWPTKNSFQYYEWAFRLPNDFYSNIKELTGSLSNRQSYLDPAMSVIIAQWHGSPDRLSYRYPDEEPWIHHQLKIKGNDTASYQQVLHEYQVLKKQGALFDQGGFPPLALKIQDGYIALIANYYRYRIHDRRLTRCPKLKLAGERAAVQGMFYVCDYQDYKLKRYDSKETIQWAAGTTLVWKAALNDIDIADWQPFKLSIHWPRWQADDNEDLNMGLLTLDAGASTLKRRLTIPIGNNDNAYPYFKFGVYKSKNAKHLPIQVDYNLTQLRMSSQATR